MLARSLRFGVILPVMIAAAYVLGMASNAAAQTECPYLILSRDVTLEIAEIKFIDQVQGVDGNSLRVPTEQQDKFRLALVTIRIKKPAGKRLTVAAADFTLHYNHGSSQEVAPCEGISTFTRNLDDERGMKLFRGAGPGWVKQTTGLKATEASEIYMDAVFHLIEPEIREVWLCVAQPVTEKCFLTNGWSPGSK